MISKRKLVIIAVIVFSIFITVTYYLLVTLNNSESVSKSTVHDLIHKELGALPLAYKRRIISNDDHVEDFLKNVRTGVDIGNLKELWKIANSWVSSSRVVDLGNPYLGHLYLALKKAKITKADVDSRGTQLKLLLTLEGGQTVVFKPRWYSKDKVFEGPVYAGKDRYGSEIVGFYLSVALNHPFTPLSVERVLSLSQEVMPVASKLLKETSYMINNRTCIYGKCYYCNKKDPICEDFDLTLPGAVIFNLNQTLKTYRSPWQRTYKKTKKAAWEESEDYCKYVKSKLSRQRILDLVDTAIFDFLLQNGDRHHYETLYSNVILLDNGKGFSNPNVHHLDILAPLYQCCTLRSGTLKKLQNLAGGTLRKYLETMPDIRNLIAEEHLKAIDDRLLMVFATIEYCRNRNKID